MWSLHLDNIHCKTTLVVTCYYYHWKVYTMGQCRAVHVIIALGNHKQSYNVGRGMPAWPLGATHGWMTLGVGCNHCLWTTYMVGRDRAFYAIIAIGKHKRSDDVRRDMPSLPLDITHGGTTSAWYAIIALGQHIRLEKVRWGIPLWPLGSTHGWTTSGVRWPFPWGSTDDRNIPRMACHYLSWLSHFN